MQLLTRFDFPRLTRVGPARRSLVDVKITDRQDVGSQIVDSKMTTLLFYLPTYLCRQSPAVMRGLIIEI
jgi:hypothetical protein